MSRVRLILAALLFCCCARVTIGDCLRFPENAYISKTMEGGYISLTKHTTEKIVNHEGTCFQLICEGSASPHRKITWYRYLNGSVNSTALPISKYWSLYNYYQISTTSSAVEESISSTLTINKFNQGHVGLYYCVIYNGKGSVSSPATNLTIFAEGYSPHGEPPDLPPIERLAVSNISAIAITNRSILLKWDMQQERIKDNYCKLWSENRVRRTSYNWTIEVLRWDDWKELYDDSNSEPRIKMEEYYPVRGNINTVTLTEIESCTNRSYLLTNLSLASYYKFQIRVIRIRVNKTTMDVSTKEQSSAGSVVHFFGKQSAPQITYPTSHAMVCGRDNVCIASGDPLPRTQLLKKIDNEDSNAYCLAENIYVDQASGSVELRQTLLPFNFMEDCVPLGDSTPKSKCSRFQASNATCSRYISNNSKIFVPLGKNVAGLAKMAEEVIRRVATNFSENDECFEQLKGLICNSYLSPCNKGRDPAPIDVCSCRAVSKCNAAKFGTLSAVLSEWQNCSILTDTKTSLDCIHLRTSFIQQELHTDGSCVVGRGRTYTGDVSSSQCVRWDKQEFYNTSVFTELSSAGSSCRNPNGNGDRPWCYVSSQGNEIRWEYCDVPKCASCEPVPNMCKNISGYASATVYFTSASYPPNKIISQCIHGDGCGRVWNTIACHLAYPRCVETTAQNTVHTHMPLCSGYCNDIKRVLKSCPMLASCNTSLFIQQLDCDNLPAGPEGCVSADLDSLLQATSSNGTKPTAGPAGNSNKHLAISIFVAAAVCLISVFTIVGIIVGYCCCCLCNQNANPGLVKPINNPLDNPVFATMKMHYIDNPDYVKTSIEKDTNLAFKSLRPISKSKIHYIRDLGAGNFGLVYQGKVDGIFDGEEFTMAAIKTLREGASAEGLKNFLHEAKLACQFDHDNIIKLYGICMSEGFYCLVFEYMDLGDLNDFLRSSASSTQRRIMNPLDSSSRFRTESSLSNNPPRLNPQQLVSICHQIAQGMEYFASLKHVHRDLATRNCLVGTGLVVKIGDFGMSQTLYHSDYYKQKGEQALPVRWMAPEAFIYGRFSTEGDVWAFGVVMWEVFSFAMQPYYGKMNDQVMNEVRRGHTLAWPDDCPDSIFEIMRSCWQMEPHRRPSFSELVEELNHWKPTHCSTSTALESQGSIRDDVEDTLSLPSIQDKDIEVFDEYNMSGTEEDIAN